MAQDMQTPRAERIHIGLFGRCNSGKSALLNAITGQEVAIVSAVAGTTTDPVSKSMELPDLGAVVLVDTAGLDDATILGQERMARTLKALDGVDIALLLFAGEDTSLEEDVLRRMRHRDIRVVPIVSQCDTLPNVEAIVERVNLIVGEKPLCVSAVTGEGIDELRKKLAATVERDQRLLTEGLCDAGDTVLLVMPQDKQAPVGRLIKPQVQTLRELLDRGCNAVCCTLESMPSALNALAEPPKLIITDSQVFDAVHKLKPEQSSLTSFSVLFARYKGDIEDFVQAAKVLSQLTASSRVLIAEACTHIPQTEDIGRVKLPRMLRRKVGEGLMIDIVGGKEFPEDLRVYDLVIHCGACMFNRRLVMSRVAQAKEQGVPITNYGVAIAALTGILNKVVY